MLVVPFKRCAVTLVKGTETGARRWTTTAKAWRSFPRQKSGLRRNPLATLPGLIAEAGRVYRRMKSGKMDHEKGRSLMWSLSQIRPMLEAQELERINARLDELGQVAEVRYGQLGQQSPADSRPARTW
jgi:hypothetical protein